MPSNVSGINSTQLSGQRPSSNARTDQSGSNATAPVAAAESLTLSDDANKIIKIESKLKSLSDVDEARVAHIRHAVANGQYHVDPQRVARKFLEVEGFLPAAGG